MLRSTSRITFLLLFSLLSFVRASAQDLSTAGAYMSHIGDKIVMVNQTYMNYLSAVSHGKSARKVEKLRLKTVNTIFDTRMDVMGTPPFKGDKTLRDATVAYLKTCHSVFNEDFEKIVNMEEIAEQSYDLMEAYLLAQEKAGDKLEEAGKKRKEAGEAFAAANGIQLVDSQSELDKKVKKSAEITDYYNKVFLIFFKSNNQDGYLTDAINRGDLNAVEQSRNALINFATEGLEKLKDMPAYASDASLVTAAKKALQFYKRMAEKQTEPTVAFLVAQDGFKKIKKDFDAKAGKQRTQADVDAFNKAVNDINKASGAYNKNNTDINKERNAVLNEWNTAIKNFMDTHMPYAK